ncbi:MAG: restriction endonuclease subunit M [Lachnospiraceae bacterium]
MGMSVDIAEDSIVQYGKSLMEILLQDKTTKKRIIWATSDYEKHGEMYKEHREITVDSVTGFNTKLIQPRVLKAKEHQSNRTRDKAEVFTPSWVCNEQNNLVDEGWFSRKNVFNTPTQNAWVTNYDRIELPDQKWKTWKDYVDARRMEVSCGEAPYLVSRYDAVSGEPIPIRDRIGLLDRKLRVINENVHDEDAWMKWAIRAVQSIYGYEFQGDNLLLARENILYTFIDNMQEKFGHKPSLIELKRVANIVAWNLWQMDGITYTIPFASLRDENHQMSIFEIFMDEDSEEDELPKRSPDAPICKIRDWRADCSVEFATLLKGE